MIPLLARTDGAAVGFSCSATPAPAIELSQEEEAALIKLAQSKLSSVRLAERARIVLLAAQGLQNLQIAQELGIDRITAGRWRQRYIESGLAGIERDLPRGAPVHRTTSGGRAIGPRVLSSTIRPC